MEFLNAFSHMDWTLVLHLTWQHITLVGIAVTLAIVVGVPLGVLMTRFPSLAGPMQASATVLLTIPSIALFGLLLPFYSTFGQGLGPMPAITAVFLYSLLPIMRNTFLALTGVEPGIREAARGIGMTFGQRLRMVELPIAVPVILAILIGVPLGVLMTRFPSLAGPLQASATVLLTIPSIALFGLLLPFYSKFGQGLGPMPAITAVFLYSLLPIMRNTFLALTGVEPGIREAARGIGMTFSQRLRMVELPIAVPVILAGVRTAVVMNIGVMTIAATIGAGGLGVLILAAISRSDMSMLIVGAVLVSVLAIIADLLLQWLLRSLTPKGLLK